MRGGEKQQFIDDMLQKVRALSVNEIISMRMNLKPNGRHFMGLCPFHNDTHYGSFLVTPDKGLWKCFACDMAGSGIKFISEYDGITWLNAAFQIAYEKGLISSDEYDYYFKRSRYDKAYERKLQEQDEKKVKINYPKASPEVCDAVFREIAKSCALSSSHKDHLLNERHLSEEDLSKFFTFPDYRKDIPGIVMKNLGITADTLITVPGFFFDEKKNKVSFCSYKGIGILCMDKRERILGIQIRKDTISEGQQRYVWFGSSFAHDKEGVHGGASAGTPIGFEPAKTLKNDVLCITEGKFKALALASGMNVLYLQGCGNWKGIERIISSDFVKYKERPIFFFFDSDMLGNEGLFEHLTKMATALKKEGCKRLKVVTWPIALGKGIDDLKNNPDIDFNKTIRVYDFDDFEKKYLWVERKIWEMYGIEKISDIRKFSKEKIKNYRKNLQTAGERVFCK